MHWGCSYETHAWHPQCRGKSWWESTLGFKTKGTRDVSDIIGLEICFEPQGVYTRDWVQGTKK